MKVYNNIANTKILGINFNSLGIIAIYGNKLSYSTDGNIWTNTSINIPLYSPFLEDNINDFYITSDGAYSTHGLNWRYSNKAPLYWGTTYHTNIFPYPIYTNIIINDLGTRYLAAGYGLDYFGELPSQQLNYSNNGINWNACSFSTPPSIYASPGIGGALTGLAYGNGTWIATSNDTNGGSGPAGTFFKFCTSTDGINFIWDTYGPVSYAWPSICYGNGYFVAVSNDSTNGGGGTGATTTTYGGGGGPSTSLPNGGWTSICYGNGKFVVVATDNAHPARNLAYYSTDGYTWYASITPPSWNKGWSRVIFKNGIFIASALNNLGTSWIAYSTDGMNWYNPSSPPLDPYPGSSVFYQLG